MKDAFSKNGQKELPAEWQQTRIGEIADVIAGGTPKAGDPENFAEAGTEIAWLTPADLSGYQKKFIAHGSRDLSRKGYETSSAKIMPAGSLLFSSRAPIGYVAIAKNPITTNQGFKNFVFHKGIDPSFAYYFLRSIKETAESFGSGTTFKEISGATAKKLPFIIAPLAEQKVIAAKLDELLGQVDRLKTRLDAIPAILKRFRQSVLAAAVSGKLTEDWRGESNYDALGYPVAWENKRLSEIGSLARGKSKHRPRNDRKLFGDKYPFIQTGEVANSGGRIIEANKFYSDIGLRQSKLFPRGTLCITIAANIADTAILEIDACFPDSIVGFTANLDLANTSFVKYLIDSNKNSLDAFAPATAQKNINLKVLHELRLPIPPLPEQTEIVRSVEQLFAFADQIEQQVKNAQSRVNHMTQSILAKAFRGDLTADWRAQYPDLITGENSAQALLERIKAERITTPAKRSPRTRKTPKQPTPFPEPEKELAVAEDAPKYRGRNWAVPNRH